MYFKDVFQNQSIKIKGCSCAILPIETSSLSISGAPYKAIKTFSTSGRKY